MQGSRLGWAGAHGSVPRVAPGWWHGRAWRPAGGAGRRPPKMGILLQPYITAAPDAGGRRRFFFMVYRQMRGRKIDVNFAIARGRARAGSWLWMSQGLQGLPVPRAPPGPLLQAGWMGALAETGLGASCPAWRPCCCFRGWESRGSHPYGGMPGGMLCCSGGPCEQSY